MHAMHEFRRKRHLRAVPTVTPSPAPVRPSFWSVSQDGTNALARADASGGVVASPEAVFEQLLSEWKDLRDSRFQPIQVRHEVAIVRAFQRFCKRYPWEWIETDWTHYSAARKAAGRSDATRRNDQSVIDQFSRYISDPGLPFAEVCARYFERAPRPIVTDRNRLVHAGDNRRRDARPAEIEAILNLCVDRMASIETKGGKGYFTSWRDHAMVWSAYGWGFRANELAHLDVGSFGPSPVDPERYGNFGMASTRHGKRKRGGPYRARSVYTTEPFIGVVDVMDRYIREVRPRFPSATAADREALFVDDRGKRLASKYISERFARLRVAAGVSKDVSLHTLRHSFQTVTERAGYDRPFASRQLGHENPGSTARYSHLTAADREAEILDHHRRMRDRGKPLP